MSSTRKIAVALAVLAIGISLPAFAGVPKVMYFEEFSATW